MAFKPHCRKCGERHFNFLRCSEVEEYMDDLSERREKKEKEETPNVIWADSSGKWAPDKTPLWARKRDS